VIIGSTLSSFLKNIITRQENDIATGTVAIQKDRILMIVLLLSAASSFY
jgi:hypothetical protein